MDYVPSLFFCVRFLSFPYFLSFATRLLSATAPFRVSLIPSYIPIFTIPFVRLMTASQLESIAPR